MATRKATIAFTERELDALVSLMGETLDHSDAVERWRSYDPQGVRAGFRAYDKVTGAYRQLRNRSHNQ